MKELEVTFFGRGEMRGFYFEQVDKTNNGYLYKVTQDAKAHYEVFKRKENSQFNCISYPSAKAFGLWAYTTDNLDRAKELLKTFSHDENQVLSD